MQFFFLCGFFLLNQIISMPLNDNKGTKVSQYVRFEKIWSDNEGK